MGERRIGRKPEEEKQEREKGREAIGENSRDAQLSFQNPRRQPRVFLRLHSPITIKERRKATARKSPFLLHLSSRIDARDLEHDGFAGLDLFGYFS